MSLTDKNAVLILGAGVSAPFGMPLGGQLIDQIARQLKLEREALSRRKAEFPSPYEFGERLYRAASHAESFREFPIYGAVASRWAHAGTFRDGADADIQRLGQLERLLDDQTSETIDDFIVENPGVADLTKTAIGALFLRASYEAPGEYQHTCQPRAFQARTIGARGQNRNWVHLLINIIRHGIRRGTVDPGNKVRIITFNYDCILEYVLEKQFANTEAKRSHFSDFIEIAHVHGRFGQLTPDLTDAAGIARAWGDGICVVNEDSPPEGIKQQRAVAREMIADADYIYAAGFAFAGPNCRLLGFDELGRESRRKEIHYCNYDGSMGVKLNAERLARQRAPSINVFEAAGSPDRPLDIADWLRSGHLGEMPG